MRIETTVNGGEVTIEDGRELLASPDQREMLRGVPDELRNDIQAFFGREMDPAEFVDWLQDQAEVLERSAAALEADEEIDTATDANADTEDGESA